MPATLRLILCAFTVGVAAALAACGDEDALPAAQPQPQPQPQPSPSAAAAVPPPRSNNSAPTIEGSPPTVTLAGRTYWFRPSAADADHDRLRFTIENCPSWASFSTVTGRLSGKPSPSDIGSSAEIRIAVTDDTATTTLPPFSIDVVATATGSATLSWLPPTANTDGTALSDLSGYRIRWGTQAGDFANSVSVDNPGLASYTVDQLTPATWQFAVTAVNSNGIESPLSNSASKTVQ